MRCANTEAMNGYMAGQEEAERAEAVFEGVIETQLMEIIKLQEEIRYIASNFEYGSREYDFTDYANELIGDV